MTLCPGRRVLAFDGFLYCLKNMEKLKERPAELKFEIFSQLFGVVQVVRMKKEEKELYGNAIWAKLDNKLHKDFVREQRQEV